MAQNDCKITCPAKLYWLCTWWWRPCRSRSWRCRRCEGGCAPSAGTAWRRQRCHSVGRRTAFHACADERAPGINVTKSILNSWGRFFAPLSSKCNRSFIMDNYWQIIRLKRHNLWTIRTYYTYVSYLWPGFEFVRKLHSRLIDKLNSWKQFYES
jgi:hypothetical protein